MVGLTSSYQLAWYTMIKHHLKWEVMENTNRNNTWYQTWDNHVSLKIAIVTVFSALIDLASILKINQLYPQIQISLHPTVPRITNNVVEIFKVWKPKVVSAVTAARLIRTKRMTSIYHLMRISSLIYQEELISMID